MILTLIRHGQTEGSINELYYGAATTAYFQVRLGAAKTQIIPYIYIFTIDAREGTRC